MPRQIYANLPATSLPRSRQFFDGLEFDFNPVFSNAVGAAMIVAHPDAAAVN